MDHHRGSAAINRATTIAQIRCNEKQLYGNGLLISLGIDADKNYRRNSMERKSMTLQKWWVYATGLRLRIFHVVQGL